MDRVKATLGLFITTFVLLGCEPVSPVEGVWVLQDHEGGEVKPCRRLELKQDMFYCDQYAFRTSYTLENDVVTVVLPLGIDAKTEYRLVEGNQLQLDGAQGVTHTYLRE